MTLSFCPNASAREDLLRQNGSHTVECVVDDLVEHVHQEGKALEHSAMDIVLEPGSIGRLHGKAEQFPHLARMVCCCHMLLCTVLVALVVAQKFLT